MLINGLKNILERKPSLFLGIIIYLFVISLCLEFFYINIFDVYKYSNKTFMQANNNQFKLVDLADDLTTNIINDFNHVMNLKKFYNELCNNPNFVFYEGFQQPTSIMDFKGNDLFLDGYEYGQTSESFTINSKVYKTVKQILINYNKLQSAFIDESIIDGSSFAEDDFIFKGYDRVPIILGYDYDGFYKIGDKIDGILSMGVECTYEVMGILNKDTNIIINGELIFLDRYILRPAFIIHNEPNNHSELLHHGFTYLQKINGTVEITNDDYTMKDFLIELERYRLKYNIFEITIMEYPMLHINALKFLAYENAQTLVFLFILLLIFNVITLCAYIIYKVKLNSYFYKVYLLSGYGVKDVKKIANFEIVIPASISFVLVFFFLNIFMEEILLLSLPFIVCFYLFIIIFSMIVTNLLFKNTDLEMFTEGE